jgi:hypothetical protein
MKSGSTIGGARDCNDITAICKVCNEHVKTRDKSCWLLDVIELVRHEMVQEMEVVFQVD